MVCKAEVLPEVAPSKSCMGMPPSKLTGNCSFHCLGVGVYESVWFLHRLQQRLRYSKIQFQKKKKKTLCGEGQCSPNIFLNEGGLFIGA